MKVIPIRDGRPSLTNIPNQLRQLAGRLEDNPVESVLVVIAQPEDYPQIMAFGDIHAGNEPIIQLELAKKKLLDFIVKRTF